MFDTGWERGVDGAPSRAWSSEEPSAALTAALMGVEPIDPVDDDGYDAVERIGAWEALAAWAIAQQVDTVVELLESRQARAGASRRAQNDQFAATAMELATMARVAPVTGEHRLHQALALARRLPCTLEALRAGRIAYSHARVVVEQTQDCDDAAAGAVDARYWGGPGSQGASGQGRERTPTQTRERVRRILQRLDPEALRRRAQAARAGRTVRYWSDDDGATGVITLRLPADQARGVFAVIDAAAHRAVDPAETPPEQRRSLGNRRADATVDLIMNGATTSTTTSATDSPDGCDSPDVPDGPDAEPETTAPDLDGLPDDADLDDADTTGPDPTEPHEPDPAHRDEPDPAAGDAAVSAEPSSEPSPQPSPGPSGEAKAAGSGTSSCDGSCRERAQVRTQVRVLVAWQTLAGLAETPGELEGHGPIPADTARRLAAGPDAIWQRLLTDPVTGTARHLDLRRYRPPPSLRAFVEDRDQYCHAPGCRRPARACDLDHVIAYDHTTPDGGTGRTHPDRLKPECRRHHNLKTRRHWHCEPHEPPGEPPGVAWTSPSGHVWIVHAPSLTEPDLDAPDLEAAAGEEEAVLANAA